MSKRKRDNDTLTSNIRAVTTTASEVNFDESVQQNVLIRASHDSRGRLTTQFTHSVGPNQSTPPLSELYSTLDDDTVPILAEDFSEFPPSDVDVDYIPGESFQQASIPSDEEVFRNTVRPVQEWLYKRDEYVDEFLRHDGLGDSGELIACLHCQAARATIKCQDCFGQGLCCAACTVRLHSFQPLHQLSIWNNDFFEDCSLYDLGLKVHLNHSGFHCPNLLSEVNKFTVVDVSGVHTIHLCYCGCEGSPNRPVQLLRQRWFPASLEIPQTAFTFDFLNTFHLVNLQAKTSLYDFLSAIYHKSDNLGVKGIPSRYDQARPVVRIWRHLKMVKRSARGHAPDGVSSTGQGECAVECPACPHPGRNLPDKWDKAPESKRWLYTLCQTIDANFRLKLKDRGYADDPPLGDGWGHWVALAPFLDYVKKWGWQVEPNLCDSHLKATDHGTSKKTTVFAASGAAGTLCGRHTLVRKNGLGDMHKGERYAYIDFIVFSALMGTLCLWLCLSYDICCQWSRNLKKRVSQLPEGMQLPGKMLKGTKFVIPKFHLHNHGTKCYLRYNLNFLRYSAQADYEDPERWWAHINPISMSIREMTSGSRIDMINDHAAGWNWRKITGFGKMFKMNLAKALQMQAKSKQVFREFDKTFPEHIVKEWDNMVKAWDKDMSQPNPYAEPIAETSMTEVLLELVREDEAAMKNGQPQIHKTSPANFLKMGIQLEEDQRRLAVLFADKTTTILRKTELIQQRRSLRHQITKWRDIQAVYMPGVAHIIQAMESSSNPESELLYLPSSVDAAVRAACCIPGLPDMECRLRLGQADDALNEVRRQLRITSSVIQFKRGQHQASQQLSRKSKALMKKFTEKTQRAATRYITARGALLALDRDGEWARRLKPLDSAKDLQLPRREDDEDGEKRKRRNQGENMRKLSWIWLAHSSGGRPNNVATADEVNETMRAEWAKTKARADRWEEEVLLTTEEMRRTIEFLHWKAHWWTNQGFRRQVPCVALQSGLQAYSLKQAAVCHALACSFAREWYPLLVANSIPVEWPPEYIPANETIQSTR